MPTPHLHIVVYHYVRDLPRTAFPRIKGMLTSNFRGQVMQLAKQFEMATLGSALAFLKGEYMPKSDLCLLTFDDGLKEHFTEVTPFLASLGIQGVFFLITGCLEEQTVAPVHMNHFLMASLPFDEYRKAFLEQLDGDGLSVAESKVAMTYPWDTPEVAHFKYLFNFALDPLARDAAVRRLFVQNLGDPVGFAKELYVDWEAARQMQSAGMVIGGHSHAHRPLSRLSIADLERDLVHCQYLLDSRLSTQTLWPFCYPYGKKDSYSADAVRLLRNAGCACAFTTEVTLNRPGQDLFSIGRVDCKCAPVLV
jgi:peptidoglycan/xylan/chitin deacetylase (PgdA/CDA1 family)